MPKKTTTKPTTAPAEPRALNIGRIALARGISRTALAERLGMGERALSVLNVAGLADPADPRTRLTLEKLTLALGMTDAEAEAHLRPFVTLGEQHRAARAAEREQRRRERDAGRQPRPAPPTPEQVEQARERRVQRGAKLDSEMARRNMRVSTAAGRLGVSVTMLFKLRRRGFGSASDPWPGRTAEEIEQALGFEAGALA